MGARGLYRDMLELPGSIGYIPDDCRAVALAIRAPHREVSRWWDQVRELFQPFGEELTHHEVMAAQAASERSRTQRSLAAKSRWDNARAMRSACESHASRIAEGFAHDKERGRDAGTQAYAVGVLSTQKEKASESAEAASPAAAVRVRKPRAIRPLSPKQQRALAEQEFPWDGIHEAHLQEARGAYPSNRLRVFSDGTTTKCLPGTAKQTKMAWIRILLDHPEITPRLLKLCLFAYLDQFDLDCAQGIQAGLVNLPTFWDPEKEMWAEWLGKARENQARFDAEAQAAEGRLPFEVEA
jgi:hypothetical protein